MTGIEAYLLAMAYTKKAIEGAGALKGAACQIKSIAPITGGNRVTFLWEDNEGVQSEDYMDVMNGADGTDGTDGVGISSITFKEKDVDGNNVYTVTLTNSNTYDIVCPKGAQGETGSTGATGNGIASIEKTGTEGLVDTYTITYTNGQTSTFTVTNGQTPTVDSAMSDSSANPVENRVIDAQLKTKANQAQLATVEVSTTASKAYSANEYLVLGGVLYKVTANIAQGGTIVTEGAGKNVDLATVGGELSALKSGKQDTLTFDNAPTDGSNNPVKSDGIYDALAGKQDIFERISYADWQLLSPQQQAAKPYYIYDYPSTQITAANVSYDHTQSGLSATTAQGGIDELASEKQDATDNNLTTTNKTIVGGINEVKSGLIGVTDTTITNVKLIKVGRLVNMLVTDWTTAFTVPSGFRPIDGVYGVCKQRVGSQSSSEISNVYIGVGGGILLSGSNTEFTGSFTWHTT